VEGAHVEALAQRRLRFSAQRSDAQLAQLVAQRLARMGDVAVDLDLIIQRKIRGVRVQVVDGLLAGPAHRVDAGVRHQPGRAQQLVGQVAEARERLAQQPQFRPQSFRVQRPAFAVGHVPAVAAERRQLGIALGARDLQVVAGQGFVQGQGFDFPHRPGVQARRVDHQRRHAVRAAGFVIGAALALGAQRLHRLDRQFVRRNRVEQQRQLAAHARDGAAVAVQQRLRLREEQSRVAACEGDELRQVAAKAGARHQRRDLGADARHFLHAQRVDLGRQEVGGGGAFHQQGVPRRSAGQAGGRDGRARGRQVLAAHDVLELLQAGRQPGDGGLAVQRQFFAHWLRDGGRQAPERFGQGAVAQVLAQCAQLGRQPGHQHFRRRPAGADPFAQLLDDAVDVARHGVQPGDVGAVIVLGHERHLRRQLRQADVDAVARRDRLRVEGDDGGPGQAALLVGHEQVEREQILAGQLAAVELARQFQHASLVFKVLGGAGERAVGQGGVVAVVAERRGVFGLVLQAPLPVALEQGAGLVLGVIGGHGAGRRQQQGGGQQDDHGQREGQPGREQPGRGQSRHRKAPESGPAIVANGACGQRRGGCQPRRQPGRRPPLTRSMPAMSRQLCTSA
jgi:hypothetical protein